jgi:hypothetical protein
MRVLGVVCGSTVRCEKRHGCGNYARQRQTQDADVCFVDESLDWCRHSFVLCFPFPGPAVAGLDQHNLNLVTSRMSSV